MPNNKVGAKGQVVIEKAIREQLGIEEGYVAVQRIVGDRVEIRFHPPEHNQSLLGILAPWVKQPLTQAELDAARERAWEGSVKRDWQETEWTE